jgi:purine-binding chemotaxis protein CheW
VQKEQEPAPAGKASKYLTFRLGGEVFAIDVLRVREVMGIQKITTVPEAPAYIKGVIHLRGKMIPVVDLRLKLGLPEREATRRTCIVVAQIENGPRGQLLIGLIVDRVSQVLTLPAKTKSKVKILSDIDTLLPAREAQQFLLALRGV